MLTFKQYEKGLGDSDTFEFNNPNPDGRSTGDCSTRAIALALGVHYDVAIELQCSEAKRTHYGLTDTEVVVGILESNGFVGHKIGASAKGVKRATAGDIAKTYHDRACVISVAGHFTVSRYGKILDTWNCSHKTAYGVWYR